MNAGTTDAVVLGFDFGVRRIGIAVGNPITATATPLDTLHRSASEWDEIGRIISEWQPRALVVGLPYNADGSESEMTRRARKFARQLNGRYGIPVHVVDERWTSTEAEDSLRRQRRGGERRKRLQAGDVDREAARLILESWLRNSQDM